MLMGLTACDSVRAMKRAVMRCVRSREGGEEGEEMMRMDLCFVSGGRLFGLGGVGLGKGVICKGGRGKRRVGVIRAALATKRETVEGETDVGELEGEKGGFVRDESMTWELQENYKVVDEKTGLPLRYDGKVIREYWDKKPVELQSRWTYFLGVVVPFGTKLISNLTAGTVDKNQRELARDFRIVLEKLGPTFVKLGQVR